MTRSGNSPEDPVGEGRSLCSADISRSGESPGRGPRLVECSNERKGEYGEVFGFLFNTSFL